MLPAASDQLLAEIRVAALHSACQYRLDQLYLGVCCLRGGRRRVPRVGRCCRAPVHASRRRLARLCAVAACRRPPRRRRAPALCAGPRALSRGSRAVLCQRGVPAACVWRAACWCPGRGRRAPRLLLPSLLPRLPCSITAVPSLACRPAAPHRGRPAWLTAFAARCHAVAHLAPARCFPRGRPPACRCSLTVLSGLVSRRSGVQLAVSAAVLALGVVASTAFAFSPTATRIATLRASSPSAAAVELAVSGALLYAIVLAVAAGAVHTVAPWRRLGPPPRRCLPAPVDPRPRALPRRPGPDADASVSVAGPSRPSRGVPRARSVAARRRPVGARVAPPACAVARRRRPPGPAA